MAVHIERVIEVETNAVKAYKILADPTNIPRYLPDIEHVAVTSITPRLVGTRLTMRTVEHKEMNAEVVEALTGKACAFRTDSGRIIRWTIEGDHPTRLTNTIDSPEEMDENRLGPELDRKLRALRSQFHAHRA